MPWREGGGGGGDGRGAFRRIAPSQVSTVEVAQTHVVEQGCAEQQHDGGEDWKMLVDKMLSGVRRRISSAVWRLSCTIVHHRMKNACMDHTARAVYNAEQALQKNYQDELVALTGEQDAAVAGARAPRAAARRGRARVGALLLPPHHRLLSPSSRSH